MFCHLRLSSVLESRFYGVIFCPISVRVTSVNSLAFKALTPRRLRHATGGNIDTVGAQSGAYWSVAGYCNVLDDRDGLKILYGVQHILCQVLNEWIDVLEIDDQTAHG